MKNILVPTDFSDNAFKALTYAIDIAGRSGARIHLLHAYILLENPFVDRKSIRDAYNEQQKQAKTAAILQVKQSAQSINKEVLIEVHLFVGPVDNTITQYCSTHAIDLVVMGTQGATGLAEMLVGSVAAGIISQSAVPVLCIPKDYNGTTPSSILFTVRQFEKDKHLLSPITTLAALYNIPVRIAVFENEGEDHEVYLFHASQLEEYRLYLQSAYPELTTRTEVVDGEDFEEAIQEYCDKYQVGILAMITYKRGFWQQLFDPSRTKKMAYSTRVPLLALPGGGE